MDTRPARGTGTVILTATDGREVAVRRDGVLVGDGPPARGRYLAPAEPPQPAPGTPKPPTRYVVAVVTSSRARRS